jgi:hypothetical protein
MELLDSYLINMVTMAYFKLTKPLSAWRDSEKYKKCIVGMCRKVACSIPDKEIGFLIDPILPKAP